MTRVDEKTEMALIINATLQFDEILEYILADFGVTGVAGGRAQRLMALNKFLIDHRRAGINTVIIFDEAQNLDIQALEYIRLLFKFRDTFGEAPADRSGGSTRASSEAAAAGVAPVETTDRPPLRHQTDGPRAGRAVHRKSPPRGRRF